MKSEDVAFEIEKAEATFRDTIGALADPRAPRRQNRAQGPQQERQAQQTRQLGAR